MLRASLNLRLYFQFVIEYAKDLLEFCLTQLYGVLVVSKIGRKDNAYQFGFEI